MMKRLSKIFLACLSAVIAFVIILLEELEFFSKNEESSSVVIIEDKGSELDNLKYGIPKADVVLNRIGFAIGYSETKHQPLWVSYILTDSEVTNHVAVRTNFQKDMIVGKSPTPSDYNKAGYDRGHIAPAADMAWSETAMSNSFYMSNMCPQTPMFNRGIWKHLEGWVRDTAVDKKSIAVYSGPIFSMCSSNICIGSSCDIEVPVAFYKVVMIDNPTNMSMIAFVLNNESSNSNLLYYVKNVDYVENLTGLDFFNSLDDKIEEDLEGRVDLSKWNYLEGNSSSRHGDFLSKSKKVKKTK